MAGSLSATVIPVQLSLSSPTTASSLTATADTVCEFEPPEAASAMREITPPIKRRRAKNTGHSGQSMPPAAGGNTSVWKNSLRRFKHKPKKAAFARSRKKILERMPKIEKPSVGDTLISSPVRWIRRSAALNGFWRQST